MSALNRPQKLHGEHRKYSLLIQSNILEALQILAEKEGRTLATHIRNILEKSVLSSETFKQ
jgi:predicted DNA-binding protein